MGRPPSHIPAGVWTVFVSLGLIACTGTFLILSTFGGATGTEPAFTPPRAVLASPTPDPAAAGPASPVHLTVSMPSNLDPCNVDTMTIIPEEVDPYSLPLVYPIEPWFDKGQFVRTAFSQVEVVNQVPEEIRVSNKILIQVRKYESMPGPTNAAFTLCDPAPLPEFPVIEVDSATREASLLLSEDPFTILNPGDSYAMQVKLVGAEPGRYEIILGVEYTYQGQARQTWTEQSILVQAPETIQRWSSEVVTYWGDCTFENGQYVCEDAELEEPVLVTVDEEGVVVPPDESCTFAPPNRLEAGSQAQVSYRLGLRLRLREEPGLDALIIDARPRGAQLNVLDGPVCVDGYWWWNVRTAGGLTGWMAEADPRLYYLEPAD